MRPNKDPREWGPNAWRFLHDCASCIDGESYESYQNLIALLPTLLPCEKCRFHSAEYLESHPLPNKSADLHAWLRDFESEVQTRKTSSSPQPTLLQRFGKLFLAICLFVAALLCLHAASF